MNPPPHVLAASGDVSTGAILGWSLVLVFLVIGGFLAITVLRKWLAKDEDEGPTKVAFTLGDFRQMLKEGQISEEEFEKAKAQLIASTQRAAARAAEAQRAGTGPPVTDVDEIRRRAQQNMRRKDPPPPA